MESMDIHALPDLQDHSPGISVKMLSPDIETRCSTSSEPPKSGEALRKARSPLQRGLTFELKDVGDKAPMEREQAEIGLAEAAKLTFRALEMMEAGERGDWSC